MRTILLYPEFPDTFWSYKRALKFISKRSNIPPLGLLTVAALLPKEWELRLIDMNVTPLRDRDLEGCDCVFISAISIQRKSVNEIVERCRRRGVKIVAGGPLFTSCREEFPEIDHLVLNEAEVTLPPFLRDLAAGRPRRVYASEERAAVAATPVPRWDLINPRHYATLNVQYSRGCPFNCEFCDITLLFGHESRAKTAAQIVAELDALYDRGWRGRIFFVDDNFIGNKARLKSEVLPEIVRWMQRRKYPFSFNTQVSINIADDPELMRLMVEAGFDAVFIGIETPCDESLTECSKHQNRRRDLVGSIRQIQRSGLEVQGGFIVGFDNDPPTIFERQITFIQETGIVTAMVGLLNALRGTKLYQRMQAENRLIDDETGDNTDGSINFVPRMDRETLLNGYRRILSTIYSPRQYYLRVLKFLEQHRPAQRRFFRFKPSYVGAIIKSVILLGIAGKERIYYWKLLFLALFRYPRHLEQVMTFMICGYHYRKIVERNI